MALTLGTNCGFVLAAPSGSPASGADYIRIDAWAGAVKHTAPANGTVTEVGWWCEEATEAADFDVGLYSDAGAGEPELRLNVATAAKGTTGGVWKSITGLNWAITSGTVYWIAVQLDDTATQTGTYQTNSGSSGYALKQGTQTELPADWGASSLSDADGAFAIYAVYTAGASGNPWYHYLHQQMRRSWTKVNGLFRPSDPMIQVPAYARSRA